MNLRIVSLSEKFAKEICSFKYTEKYSIYNYPKWEKCVKERWAITIDEKRKNQFYAVTFEDGGLMGYMRLLHKGEYIK
ncbi:hypothetical protein ACER0A_013145 [Haloimpatiens sp. FM7315]|uniref:hypothetical protein n=1 Tax=Haloimpatiens sp. FM7315 TaxID=3298609 RepID=UPI003709CCB2